MAKSKLKDDNINLNLSVGTDKTQENIRKLGDETFRLKQKNDQLLESMAKLSAQGKDTTATYVKFDKQLTDNQAKIESNNSKIKELTKSLNINHRSSGQLRKEANELSKIMSKLDPQSADWAKLNEELQRVNGRMREIKSATYDTRGFISKTADTINRYWSVLAAGAAALIGGIKAIGSTFKSVISSTQGTANEWNKMVAGMKSGWDYFLKSVATGDWSGFYSNLKTAIQAGKDYSEAMAESDKKLRSLRFTQAEDRTEIARLKAQLEEYNLSATEKLKIQDEIGKRTQRLSDTEFTIRQEMYDAELEFLSKSNGVTEEADKKRLERIIKEYNQNKDLIEQAKEYNEQIAAATITTTTQSREGFVTSTTVPDEKRRQQINEETSILVRDAADALKDYSKLTNEELDRLTETYEKLQAVIEGQFGTEAQYNKKRSLLLKKQVKSEADLLKEKENIWETEHQIRLAKLKQARKDESQSEVQYQAAVSDEEMNAYTIRIKGYEDFLAKTGDSKLRNEIQKKLADERSKQLDVERAYEQARLNLLQENRDKDLKVAQDFYDSQKAQLDKDLAQKRLTQDQYDLAVIALDAGSATDRLTIQKKYQAEVVALELQNGDLKVKAVEAVNAEVMAADVKAAQDRATLLRTLAEATLDFRKQFSLLSPDEESDLQLQVLEKAYQARFELMMANGEDTTELTKAFEQAKTRIILRAEEDRFNLRKQLGITSWKEEHDIEMANLKQLLEEKKITQEEYEEAVLDARVGYLNKYFQYYSQQISGTITALQDAEIANIDAKYEAEIAAAGNNAEQVEKLEEEKAQKTLDVQKKYADVNFAIKAAQIIADTAVGIMAAFQLGPIAGAIAAALIGVNGVAQLAAANAERKKVKAMTLKGGSSAGGQRVVTSGGGFAEGGYTGNGARLEPAGIVHKGEYVVAAPELRRPDVMAKVQSIERLRGKRLGGKPLTGFADGGFTDDANRDSATALASDSELKEMVALTNSLLQNLIDNGVKAPVVLSDFERQQALKNSSEQLGTR